MTFFKRTVLVATVAVSAVSAGYHVSPPPSPTPTPTPTPVISDCFTLFARHADGTYVGFFNIYDDAFDTRAALTNESAMATKLGLDTSTGRLIDYESDPYRNGVIASAGKKGSSYPYITFDTFTTLSSPLSETAALTCELSNNDILTCSQSLNPDNYIQYCATDAALIFANRDAGIEFGDDCAPVTFSATAATSCVTPTGTFTLPPTSTITTTTTPSATGAPEQRFICPGGEEPTLCADDFLVKCSDQVSGANVTWYDVFNSVSEYTCHELCVLDPDCTGYQSYYEEIDLHHCSHTHDTFSPDTTFSFYYYFYTVGVRGFCQ